MHVNSKLSEDALSQGHRLTGSALTALHRDLIITLADRYNLPAIYYERSYVKGGGLITWPCRHNRPQGITDDETSIVAG
jgi:hypothetical protein